MTVRSGWVLACVVGVVGIVLGTTVGTVQFATRADENVYLQYAAHIARRGPAGFPELAQMYLQQPEQAHYLPTPLRVTTILVDAVAVRVWGKSFSSLQVVSLGAFLGLLVLVFGAVRRSVDERTALWTTLLVSASPLHLAMARRALSDSLVAALLLASLWVCLRALRSPRAGAGIWWVVSAVYAVTFLSKEAAVVLIPVSFVFIGLFAREQPRGLLWPISAVSIVPLAAAGLAMMIAAGGFSAAVAVLRTMLGAIPGNTYANAYGGGPWYRYLVDALLLSPWVTVLYIIWLGCLLGMRTTDRTLWAWALIPVLLVGCTAASSKNIRYVLVLETPMRLGAVLVLQLLIQRVVGGRWAWWVMAGAVFLLMWVDWYTFSRLFLEGGIYDPVSASLLRARRFLPP